MAGVSMWLSLFNSKISIFFGGSCKIDNVIDNGISGITHRH
jgi:hypothetical protein